MKPAPKSPEFERFRSALQRIMSVPKSDIVKREQEQKEARRAKKRAASGHASGENG